MAEKPKPSKDLLARLVENVERLSYTVPYEVERALQKILAEAEDKDELTYDALRARFEELIKETKVATLIAKEFQREEETLPPAP